jgi:hypothetical protein
VPTVRTGIKFMQIVPHIFKNLPLENIFTLQIQYLISYIRIFVLDQNVGPIPVAIIKVLRGGHV